jgi:competence protein ComEC
VSPPARAFAAAGAFVAGVLVAEALHAAAWACVLTGAAAPAALVAARGGGAGRRAAAVLAAATLLGACLAGLRLASLERGALARGGLVGADAMLRGRVLARPESSGGSMRFLLGVARATIDGAPVRVRERVLVSVRPPPERAPALGDALEVDARLGPRLPARADARSRASAARLRNSGVSARAFVRPEGLRRIGRGSGALDTVARAGQRAAERAAGALPAREAGLLLGITVGDDARLDPDMEADFRATGLTHLLAVSGTNLAMFLGAVGVALRALRLRRRGTIAGLATATLAFMAITRFEPSVLRAGAMAAVALAGLGAGAGRHTLHALGLAAFGLLVWDPFLVHSAGFQLSALATLGILVIAPRLAAALPRHALAAAAAVTMGAQLAVAPLIALQFHQSSLVALPANLLAVPAVAPATVLGFVGATAGIVWAPAAAVCATLARPFLWWMGWVAGVFARVPHASVATPAGLGAALTVAAAAALAIAAARVRRIRLGVVVLATALLVAGSTWSAALAPPEPGGLRVTALDVGQGDAILVEAPGGATMLVDGGPDAGVARRRLRAHHVRRLDLVVLTHPHADHVVGLAAVVARYPVGRALDAGDEFPQPAYERYRSMLAARRIPRDIARTGMRYALGPVVVEVLGPAFLFSGTDSDPNNDSVVLRLTYGRSTALLSGDVQEEAQEELLSHPSSLRATLFKVPHHGSRKALREFFAATGGRVALISVGAGNDFGHPAISTLGWLAELGMRTYRTDRSGDVTVALGKTGGFRVLEEHAARAA